MKLLIVGAAGLALAGCVAHENDRMTVGRSVRLEVFDPPEAAPAPVDAPVLPEQSPTLTGVERRTWEPTIILVPVDGTAHRPVYTHRLHLTEGSARQRREYPTALSSLKLTEGSETDQQLEALGNDLLALADAVLFIPLVILQPPWRTHWSPDVAYERYWRPQLTPAVVEGEAVTAPPLPPEAERPPAGADEGAIEVRPSEPR